MPSNTPVRTTKWSKDHNVNYCKHVDPLASRFLATSPHAAKRFVILEDRVT